MLMNPGYVELFLVYLTKIVSYFVMLILQLEAAERKAAAEAEKDEIEVERLKVAEEKAEKEAANAKTKEEKATKQALARVSSCHLLGSFAFD